jgi:hypothetical protein
VRVEAGDRSDRGSLEKEGPEGPGRLADQELVRRDEAEAAPGSQEADGPFHEERIEIEPPCGSREPIPQQLLVLVPDTSSGHVWGVPDDEREAPMGQRRKPLDRHRSKKVGLNNVLRERRWRHARAHELLRDLA